MKEPKWILLVEDDINIAELTKMALEAAELGCAVVVTHDGSEALDCLYHRGEFRGKDGHPPILALLDLNMPKVNGLEVLRQIKSDERLRAVPVVMFSSSREESDVARSYRLGANAYVVKPVGYTEFERAVRAVGQFWSSVNEPSPEYFPRGSEASDQRMVAR